MARATERAKDAVGGRKSAVAAGAVAATGAALLAGKAATERMRGRDYSDGGGPSRAYRLKRSEPVGDGVRRIADGRASHALQQLAGAQDGDFASSVHEARKDLKKLRSLLRVVRDELGEEAYGRASASFRDAARRLSGPRDAEVRLATLAKLEERWDGGLRTEPVEAFRAELEAEQREARDAATDLDGAAELIVRGRDGIEDWSLRGGWKLLEPGIRRSYRRGRREMKATSKKATVEGVHEWRKRVKDLWYQLRILQDSWPGPLGEASEGAHELSDLLGDHHDLALLGERASRSPALEGADLEALRCAIAAAQSDLLAKAVPISRRLYAEKPKAFTRRLGAYWKAWRTA